MSPLIVETAQQLLDWEPPNVRPIIGRGLLLPGTKCIIFGQWGVGKSLITMDLGLCIATNRSWLGFPINRCSVMTVQTEIPKAQYQIRLKKYVHGNKLAVPPDFYVINESHLKLDKGAGAAALDAAISALKPKVLIIDPIYKVLSGDITSNYDVEKFLDQMDLYIKRYGIAVILVGHPKKPSNMNTEEGEVISPGHDLLGASYFMDWTDSAIFTKPIGDMRVELEFVKVRHAEEIIQPIRVKIDRNSLRTLMV